MRTVHFRALPPPGVDSQHAYFRSLAVSVHDMLWFPGKSHGSPRTRRVVDQDLGNMWKVKPQLKHQISLHQTCCKPVLWPTFCMMCISNLFLTGIAMLLENVVGSKAYVIFLQLLMNKRCVNVNSSMTFSTTFIFFDFTLPNFPSTFQFMRNKSFPSLIFVPGCDTSWSGLVSFWVFSYIPRSDYLIFYLSGSREYLLGSCLSLFG